MNAITDKSVHVRINSTSKNETEGGYPFFGGAFLGNELKPIKIGKDDIVGYKAITKQDVNPYDLRAMSKYYGKHGQDMLHEITESYEGGLLSLKLCKSINNSLKDKSTYEYVHNKAIPQSGDFKQNILRDYENGPQIDWRWIIGSYEKDWVLPQYR